MGHVITLLALITIFATVLYLVLNKDYEDGLIGRVALTGMALSVTLYLLAIFAGRHSPTGVEELLLWSVAVFMARHAYRFHRYQHTGRGAWRRLGELDPGWSEPGQHQTR